MIWSFSNQLLPDEQVIEKPDAKSSMGIRSTYSALLTNKRVLFRFEALGSNLTQSFFYDEIEDVQPSKRLFVNYLQVKTQKKEYFINTSDTEYLADKIKSMKEQLKSTCSRDKQNENERCILLDMLDILRKNGILTDEEYEEKVYLVNGKDF
ncbi:MAG: PH domain-containing protein [bacterium]